MRFYDQHHQYYGIDLHARSIYLCIQDNHGTVLYHKNLPTTRDAFRTAVAVECMFSWYWIYVSHMLIILKYIGLSISI